MADAVIEAVARMFLSPKIEQRFQDEAKSGLRGWANSMRAAYGVDPILVSESSQLLLVRHLATSVETTNRYPSSIDELAAVADFWMRLETTRQPQHVRWLLDEWKKLTRGTPRRRVRLWSERRCT